MQLSSPLFNYAQTCDQIVQTKRKICFVEGISRGNRFSLRRTQPARVVKGIRSCTSVSARPLGHLTLSPAATTGQPDRLSFKLFTELCGTPKANLSRRAGNPQTVGRGERWARTRRCDLMGPAWIYRLPILHKRYLRVQNSPPQRSRRELLSEWNSRRRTRFCPKCWARSSGEWQARSWSM